MTSDNSLDDPLISSLSIHRFSVEQYHQMGELGVLSSEDRVELLEGLIVEKMNQRPIHGFIVGQLNEWFQKRLQPRWIVRCKLPITTERSEPEPDLAILKGEHSDFRQKHPFGKDCHLVIEVADTSLENDRSKSNIYRQAGVQEYWIINVPDNVLERYVFSQSQITETAARSLVVQAHETIKLIIDDACIKFGLKEILG